MFVRRGVCNNASAYLRALPGSSRLAASRMFLLVSHLLSYKMSLSVTTSSLTSFHIDADLLVAAAEYMA
jgi:hypothetical protein